MELLIDSANLQHIKKIVDYFPIDGVTTNPTLITKENKPFLPLIKEIRSIIGEDRMLHVQVIATEAEEIVRQSLFLANEIGGNFYTKIPVTDEGIKAMKLLKNEGINITATTIYTHLQALMAAKAGASYLAPYVNRIDHLTGSGVNVVADIAHSLTSNGYDAKILGASFKNTLQVDQVILAGAQAVTASPDIIESLIKFPSTSMDVEQFSKQWRETFGNTSF
ncbi:fructose-6-phosphate aldolase [Bacillus sp. FJAT-50079]|uniref:fructose-6-phosphate aldolase n=1 Tax=Bacillus sp. FJAT-50079 TaxID=2833577 RepID=UPI001BC995FA|nr:fructose-6-phosphate aldolase [Bacillus sp. FJAT-50079]MBS4208234.1 fructose-6-phosphate aldolase [Bacillus sp. FJAT-50079]